MAKDVPAYTTDLPSARLYSYRICTSIPRTRLKLPTIHTVSSKNTPLFSYKGNSDPKFILQRERSIESGMPVCSKFSDFRNFDILGKK